MALWDQETKLEVRALICTVAEMHEAQERLNQELTALQRQQARTDFLLLTTSTAMEHMEREFPSEGTGAEPPDITLLWAELERYQFFFRLMRTAMLQYAQGDAEVPGDPWYS